MNLPHSFRAIALFAVLAICIPAKSQAAAADDDLFSSKPTRPPQSAPASSTAPAPTSAPAVPPATTPAAKVAAVLPSPPSSPLTPEQVDALRAHYAEVVERLKQLLQANKTDPDRDRVIRRLAEVAIDAGEYDLAASTTEFFSTEIFAIDDVLKPIMVRLHAAKNPQGVRFALGRANQLADKVGWQHTVIGRIIDNTWFAFALGDEAIFQDQLQNLITVTDQFANRQAGDVWVGLEIALKMSALHRLAPELANSFHAKLRTRVNALPDSDALKKTRRSEVAQLLFRTGQWADALSEVALAGDAAVAIYTDAASLAQAENAELPAKIAALAATYAERDVYDRFVVFALAAHALSTAGRHEDAMHVALHAETHRGTYSARPNSTYAKAPLHQEWDSLNATGLAPAEYDNVLTAVTVQAVHEGATQRVLAVGLQDPAGRPHATSLVNITLHTLLALERLDEAITVYLLHDTGDNGFGPALVSALVRAGRLDEAESALLDKVSDERRATLAQSWVQVADAWMARGDREKARAVLNNASRGNKSSDWQVQELAVGWSRLGEATRVEAARARGPQTPEKKAWFELLELQALADAGDFPSLAQRIASLPAFSKDSRFWYNRADALCETLARAGQWPLLAALSDKVTGLEQARPFVAELGEVLQNLKRAANQAATPAVAGDARVLLAPYAQWVATVPEAEHQLHESTLFYYHGRLGAWEEAFAAANAPEVSPVRRTQAFLNLANAARDNREWDRATECLARAREALALVTGADRTAPLLITYCSEALFTRDMSDLAERFREAAGLINQSTKQEDRANQFSDLALVAARAADNAAFQQLAGAAIQSATAWAKEAPGENGGPPAAEYSMAWFVRQLARMGHVDVAEKITQASITSETEKKSLDEVLRVSRLLATPDEQLVDALKKVGDQGQRLKALIDTYGDNLVVRLAEQGRSEIAFRLMLMARDGDFATSYDSQGFGAEAWSNTSVQSLLEYNWPTTVENLARTYLEAGRTAAAVKLGELYTTPRKPFASGAGLSDDDNDEDWLSPSDLLVRPNIDYTTDQARFTAFLAEKGQADEARRLLQAIPASAFAENSDYLRESVVLALAQLGELTRAETIASGIKEPTPQMNAHTGLVFAAVRSGDTTLATKHLAIARNAAADPRTKTNWKRPHYLAALVLAGGADAALEEIGTLQGYSQSNAAREPTLQMARLGRWNEIAPWISRIPASAQAGSWTAVFNDLAPRPREPSLKP